MDIMDTWLWILWTFDAQQRFLNDGGGILEFESFFCIFWLV